MPLRDGSGTKDRGRHFRVSGLEATVHRALGPARDFRITRTSAEEIRLTMEVLRWRKGDPIGSLFDHGTAGGKLAMQ